MMRWQWVVVISTVLALPACVFQPHKQSQKKSGSHLNGDGSIFASVSEENVRDDVRACHATQPNITDPTSLVPSYEGQAQTGGRQVETGQPLTRKAARKLSKQRLHERAAERQAMLADVPVPLNVQPLSDFFAQNSAVLNKKVLSLGYTVELSLDDVVRFYHQEMERHGWRVMASGNAGHEALLCFSKPDRFSSISLRSNKSKRKKPVVEIIIFTGSSASSHV